MDAVLQGRVKSLDENTLLATWYGDESKALVTSEAPTSAQQVTQPPVPRILVPGETGREW